jgi:hypothetical protein
METIVFVLYLLAVMLFSLFVAFVAETLLFRGILSIFGARNLGSRQHPLKLQPSSLSHADDFQSEDV